MKSLKGGFDVAILLVSILTKGFDCANFGGFASTDVDLIVPIRNFKRRRRVDASIPKYVVFCV